jgi:hypothetical protein
MDVMGAFMKFIFTQKTLDFYEVEADSEEEARELIYSGDILVSNTKYDDLNLIKEESRK